MQCTKCGSGNTQRLEVIFDKGTQNINTESSSGRSTTGTHQSTLAQKAAPPAKLGFVLPAVLMLGAALVGGAGKDAGGVWYLTLIAIILFLLSGLTIYGAIRFNYQSWPSLKKDWLESWFCHKCGTIYQQS